MIQEAYIQGVSTRSVDDLVKAMGMSGVSKSQVSRVCEEIDERVQTGPELAVPLGSHDGRLDAGRTVRPAPWRDYCTTSP